MKSKQSTKNRPKSQIEIDQTILNFLGDFKILTPQDLVVLKNKILNYFKSRPYTNKTKRSADSIQWRRTASEVLQDKYIYTGKACSDLAVVFLALCKAAGINGYLVKLRSMDGKETHTIVEVDLKGTWYRIEPSSKDSIPFEGQLTNKSIWNKKFKVWEKGRDVWDLGLDNKKDADKICKLN